MKGFWLFVLLWSKTVGEISTGSFGLKEYLRMRTKERQEESGLKSTVNNGGTFLVDDNSAGFPIKDIVDHIRKGSSSLSSSSPIQVGVNVLSFYGLYALIELYTVYYYTVYGGCKLKLE